MLPISVQRMNPVSPRRSILSVPGHSDKMIRKAVDVGADGIMLDLEDSVAPSAKVQARRQIIAAIRDVDWSHTVLSVRVNPVDTPLAHQDLLEVVGAVGAKIQTLVLPKVEAASHIHFVHHLLEGMGHEIALEATIESPVALENSLAIAAASPMMHSLVFGIADFSASVGAPQLSLSGHADSDLYPGHRWHYVLSRLLMAARANGLEAVDAPHGDFRDAEGVIASCHLSRSLGFDSKWAIHPAQLAGIHEVFAPGEDEIARACAVLQAFESAERDGKGAEAVGSQMFDLATVRLSRRVLAKAAVWSA